MLFKNKVYLNPNINKKCRLTMKSIFDNKCIIFIWKKRAILTDEPNPNN
jgi:hypothetical protein